MKLKRFAEVLLAIRSKGAEWASRSASKAAELKPVVARKAAELKPVVARKAAELKSVAERKAAELKTIATRKATELTSRAALKTTELSSRAVLKAAKLAVASAWESFVLSCKGMLIIPKVGLHLGKAAYWGVVPPKKKEKTEEGLVCKFLESQMHRLEAKKAKSGTLSPSDSRELEYLERELSSGEHRVTEAENGAFRKYVAGRAAWRLALMTLLCLLLYVVCCVD